MSIFLKNKDIQQNLVTPEITEIGTIEDIQFIAEYIRKLNYMYIVGGDARLCRQINGAIAGWINANTSANASMWVCSPYPNLKNKDISMEHVVCVVIAGNKTFIVDGTAGQTTISDSNIFIQEVDSRDSTSDSLGKIMGGTKWRTY